MADTQQYWFDGYWLQDGGYVDTETWWWDRATASYWPGSQENIIVAKTEREARLGQGHRRRETPWG